MHEKLTQFRQKLGASMKEFCDLPDFKAQLAYFFDLFTELKIVPAPWLIYGACAAYLHQKTGGRLVKSTASTFESSEVLAQFCGMRARYVILGLKDLFNMKIMKCSEEIGKSISEMASELDTNQSCGLESFSSSGDGTGVTFVSAITAFDAALADILNNGQHALGKLWTDHLPEEAKQDLADSNALLPGAVGHFREASQHEHVNRPSTVDPDLLDGTTVNFALSHFDANRVLCLEQRFTY